MTSTNYINFNSFFRQFFYITLLSLCLFLVGCGGGSSSSGSDGAKAKLPANLQLPVQRAVSRIMRHPVYAKDFQGRVEYGGKSTTRYAENRWSHVLLFDLLGVHFSGATLMNNVGASLVHEMAHKALPNNCHDQVFYAYVEKALAELGYSDFPSGTGGCP